VHKRFKHYSGVISRSEHHVTINTGASFALRVTHVIGDFRKRAPALSSDFHG